MALVTAPCLMGVALGVLVSRCITNRSPGLEEFLGAIGGFFGLVAFAGVLATLDALGIQTFQAGLKSLLASMLVLSALIALSILFLRRRPHDKYEIGVAKKEIGAVAGIIALSFLIVAAHIQMILISPLASWDALNFWYLWAEWYVEFDVSQDVYGRSRSSDGAFPWQHPRHPITLVRVIAFNNYLLEGSNYLSEWLIPWTCVWLLGAMLIFGFSRLVSASRVVAWIMVLGYLSMPLVENHHVLAGYAELFIACAFLCAISLIAVGFFIRRSALVVLGVLAAMVPLFFKNIGILYTVSVLAPLILVNLNYNHIRLIMIPLMVLLPFAVLAIWLDILDSSVLNLPLRRDTDTGILYISFAGYELSWSWTSLAQVVLIQVRAFLVNSSFSVTTPIVAVGLLALTVGTSRLGTTGKPFLFVLLSVFSLFAVFTQPLFLESYAMSFAAPGSDTGNSRFSLPISMVVLLLIPCLHTIAGREATDTVNGPSP